MSAFIPFESVKVNDGEYANDGLYFKSPFEIRFQLSSLTRHIPVNVIVNVIVNVQPQYNGHFRWWRELASRATKV